MTNNTIELQKSLATWAETMSNHKNGQGSSIELYAEARNRCEAIIKELDELGINPADYPIYEKALSHYNYWR